MKYLRMPFVGAGTPADPFRVSLPRYSIVWTNYVTGRCIVEISDEDYEQEQAGEVVTTVNVAPIGTVITGLDPAHRARFVQRLKDKYKERAATYDVVVA